MLSTIVLELVLILVLVVINGIFAMTEIAVVSARKGHLQKAAEHGSRRAAAALDLANNPERFLSTIQIGITLVGILAGAFGGATIAEQIDDRLETIPALAPYSEVIGVGSVVVAITYLSLVFGELVPKRIALSAPERVASTMAPTMKHLASMGAPAVALLTASTRAVLWLLRVRQTPEQGVTEEDLRLLLRQGARAGTILEIERTVVERVFRLRDRNVKALMTPRREVEWLDLVKPIDQLRTQAQQSIHSRFPVATGSLDTVTGMILSRHLWAAGTSEELRKHLTQPLFVPASVRAFALLELFRATGVHTAVVVDEYGAFEGIVTPHDVLQVLVGALPVPGDTGQEILQRDERSWLVDASVDLEDLTTALGVHSLTGQKLGAYQTAAGWFIARLGRIAKTGDRVESDGFRFEVVDIDARRIDKILVARLPPV